MSGLVIGAVLAIPSLFNSSNDIFKSCDCGNFTLYKSSKLADVVLKVTLVSLISSKKFPQTYNATVNKVYKGCNFTAQEISIVFSYSGSNCSVPTNYTLNVDYIISAFLINQPNQPDLLQNCFYLQREDLLTLQESNFLKNYFNACMGTCSTGFLFKNCTSSPCSSSTSLCKVPNNTCIDNYCNGCKPVPQFPLLSPLPPFFFDKLVFFKKEFWLGNDLVCI